MRKKRNMALALVLISIMIVMTGCTTFDNFKEAFFSEKGAASDTVKIGILEPQTGNDSEKGQMEIEGIELAYEIAGEVLGKKVELVYADTQSSIYVAESAVADLIDKKPAIVLGSYGEAVSLVASQKLGKVKIPAIAVTATNPLITKNNEYYFRVTFTDASQGKALADYVFEELGQTKAGIIKMKDEDTTSELVRQFTAQMAELTEDETSIAASVQIDSKTKDYKEYIEKIKASGVKAVFMPVSLKTADKIFAEAEKMGLTDITFIGPKDWHNNDIVELQNKYVGIKIAVASNFMSTSAEETADKDILYNQFIKAYKAKHGDSEPPEETVLGFDAYMIGIQAIEKAGSIDGYLVKEALKSTSHFRGASGEISFDETGEPTKPINVDIIKDGKFVSVYTAK
ncbi:Leucine-%2C isoleucine-%2C valine-%2C threonine-%2C and alanine-binding protein precursor [uncultured Eubacterium sp.]|nr:Leucine-%2C isoleucine-%2C valine-%2C threonine-%2C and alanine-binding protein precursor [uncultured Eubacterium sp.]